VNELAKERIPCPRCDGKGVIPQYFYNRKGICFLCWGAKYIMVKVPKGKTKDEYLEELRKKEVKHLKDNPPKVEMPDKKDHKNPSYFKDAKTKLDVEPKKDEPKKDTVTEDRDTLIVKRVEGDMVIKRGEEYSVFMGKTDGKSRFKDGKVVGISHAKKTITMEFKREDGTTYRSEFEAGSIYPLGYGTKHKDKVTGDNPETKETPSLSEDQIKSIEDNVRLGFKNADIDSLKEAVKKAIAKGEELEGDKKAVNQVIIDTLNKMIAEKGKDKPAELDARSQKAVAKVSRLLEQQKESGIDTSSNDALLAALKAGEYNGKKFMVGLDVSSRNARIREFEQAGNVNAFFQEDVPEAAREAIRNMLKNKASKVFGEHGKDAMVNFTKQGETSDYRKVDGENVISIRVPARLTDDNLEELKRTLYHELGHAHEEDESETGRESAKWKQFKKLAGKYKPSYTKAKGIGKRDLPKSLQTPEHWATWQYVYDHKNNDAYTTGDAFSHEMFAEVSNAYFEAKEGDKSHFEAVKEAFPDVADFMENYYGKLSNGKKEKPTKPAKQEIAETGRFKVYEQVHTKTGETFFTVEPKERVSMDEFKKMNAELKELGGFYDRFLKRMRFKENPVEALEKLEEGKAGEVSQKEYDSKLYEFTRRYNRMTRFPEEYKPQDYDNLIAEIESTNFPDDFMPLDSPGNEREKVVAPRRLKRRVQRAKDKVFLKKASDVIADSKTPEELDEKVKQIKSLPMLSSMYQGDVETYIQRGIENGYRKMMESDFNKAGLNTNTFVVTSLSVDELTKFKSDFEEKYGNRKDADELFTKYKDIIDVHIKKRKEKEDKDKKENEWKEKREEELKKYKEVWKKRQEILDKGVAYKDTELGRKVSEITGGKPVESKEMAIKVGAVIRDEMLKRVGSWSEDSPKLKELRKEVKELEDAMELLNTEEAALLQVIDSPEATRGDKAEAKRRRNEITKTEYPKIQDELHALYTDIEKVKSPRKRNEQAYLEIMSEIREMGEDTKLNIIKLKGDSRKSQQDKANEGTKYFPKEWIDISNQHPVRMVTEKNRAYHRSEMEPDVGKKIKYEKIGNAKMPVGYEMEIQHNYAIFGMGMDDKVTTFVHELGHRMEFANKRLESIIHDYYQTRTAGNRAAWLGRGYGKSEKYRKSNNGIDWLDTYMGKEYAKNRNIHTGNATDRDIRATEILTMGLESAIFNTHISDEYYKTPMDERTVEMQQDYTLINYDEEYFNLIMGVMAGA
jgi:hypothetical protein